MYSGGNVSERYCAVHIVLRTSSLFHRVRLFFVSENCFYIQLYVCAYNNYIKPYTRRRIMSAAVVTRTVQSFKWFGEHCGHPMAACSRTQNYNKQRKRKLCPRTRLRVSRKKGYRSVTVT